MAVGLLAILDDLVVLLDDVAVLSKVAAVKTAGIVGDDLAVNAEAVIGIDPQRELPIVWRVAKGSLLNKVLVVPIALVLSAIAPALIKPLLMLGGLFLCFEGAEKVLHARSKHKDHKVGEAPAAVDETAKVKKAIQTDLILSAEIIAVTLSTVAEQRLQVQALVLTCIGLAMTVVVYGLVAAIVKIDDLGLHLLSRNSQVAQTLGRWLLATAPRLMSVLSVVGTAAMLGVGGGIILHGIPPAAEALHHLHGLADFAISSVTGLILGMIVVGLIHLKPARPQ